MSADVCLMHGVHVCTAFSDAWVMCVCLQEHNHPRDSSYSKGAVSRHHEQGHLPAVRATGSYIHPSSFHRLRLFWYVASSRLGVIHMLVCACINPCRCYSVHVFVCAPAGSAIHNDDGSCTCWSTCRFRAIVSQLRYVQLCWFPQLIPDKLDRDSHHEHVVLLLSVISVVLLLLLLLLLMTSDPGMAAAAVAFVTQVDLKGGCAFCCCYCCGMQLYHSHDTQRICHLQAS